MQKYVLGFAALVALSLSTGCIIRTHDHTRARTSEVRSCPPAHHWEDGECVHNGNGKHKGHR